MGKIKKPSWVGTVILSGFISSLPQLAWEKKAMLLLLLLLLLYFVFTKR